MLGRKVEANLDWRSNSSRDPAKVKAIGFDPVTRLALGHYDFDCDNDATEFRSRPFDGRHRANGDGPARQPQGRPAHPGLAQHQAPFAHAVILFRSRSPQDRSGA